MKLHARKLCAVGNGEYEILIDTIEGTIRTRCRVVDTMGKPEVRFDVMTNENATVDSADLLRAVLSFHHARTATYDPPQPTVREVPPWFDPTPLKLTEIEAINDVEYKLSFTEPDGKVKTISERVITLTRDESSFLGVDVIGDPQLTARIYPRDVNAATIAFHIAAHSVESNGAN
jgi:hypothetical protein